MDKFEALNKFFGYSSFRDGQEEIIDAVIDGRDCLGVMPTGAGKSICFQLPALLLEGITLVISPLISLMKDQVNALTQNGIPAAYINASLTEGQIRTVYKRARESAYKIIYVAPERLLTFEFLRLCESIDISVVCVDEAHCVSQWGHDFRTSYLQIYDFINLQKNRPVVCCFTATATKNVRDDIIKLIGLNDPLIKVLSFDRKNLFFETVKPSNKPLELRKYLDIYSGKSGIVYCTSRKNVDELYESLKKDGYSVTKYHAGLDKDERKTNQELFIKDEKSVIIATNAFGMGIDKSNVSFVIHYNMPGDIESYYQEAGRAGRDGMPADCILFFSSEDIRIQKYFIENPEVNDTLSVEEADRIAESRNKRLDSIIAYSNTTKCLRNYILGYFGENIKQNCGHCSTCCGNIESVDVTVDSQKILSCIVRVNYRESRETVADILKGRETPHILDCGYNKLSTFSIMKTTAENVIIDLIDFLTETNYIESDSNGNLKLCEKANDILYSKKHLRRPLVRTVSSEEKEENFIYKLDPILYKRLIALRNEIARKRSLPSFIIFTDATIVAMAKMKPKNSYEMLKVPGVSEKKLSQYGAMFLAEINKTY